jgi:outer membrane murein-binding lipoprotein Lpp
MTNMMKLAAAGIVLGGLSLTGCASQRESIDASRQAAEQAATEAKQAAAEAKAAADEAKAAAEKANRSYGRSLRK